MMLALRRHCDERSDQAIRLPLTLIAPRSPSSGAAQDPLARNDRADESAAGTLGTWRKLDRPARKVHAALVTRSTPESFGRGAQTITLKTTATNFVLLRTLSFGMSAAKALFFLMTALGARKSDHGCFRRPSSLPSMDRHGPGVTFGTCDQQLIRLHCASSAII